MSAEGHKELGKIITRLVREDVLYQQTELIRGLLDGTDMEANEEGFCVESMKNPCGGHIEGSRRKCTYCGLDVMSDDWDGNPCSENHQEVKQWWIVSDWFADKLADQGTPVLKNTYGVWWGRTSDGAMDLDPIVTQIAREIL